MKTRVIQDEPEPAQPPAAPAPVLPADARDAPRPAGGAHVALIVLGAVGVLLGLVLLAGGGVSAWALGQRDDAGWFATSTHRVATSSYALTSESLDVGTDGPDWAFGDRVATIRIRARSSEPVFVGIGRTGDVARYLGGVRHAQITDVDTDPFRVTSHLEGGAAQPSAPAGQRIWRVQASGSGAQAVRWPVEKGNWSAVIMNADGSRGVDTQVQLGARVPVLRYLAIGLLGGGAVLLLGGGALLLLGARGPRRPAA